MTRKSAFYALAVAVLMGTMAVAALADDQGMSMYGPAESSVSAQPEQGVVQADTWESRAALETGAIPERSGNSSDFGSGVAGDEPTVEIAGRVYRPSVDFP